MDSVSNKLRKIAENLSYSEDEYSTVSPEEIEENISKREENIGKHPFDAAGLGKPPYKLVGYFQSKFQSAPGEPVKAGSSCDYCGLPIMNCYRIRSSDGQEFKVGSECARKVSKQVASEIEILLKKKLHNKYKENKSSEAEKIHELADRIRTDETLRNKLKEIPHPNGFINRETKEPLTYLDFAEWMIQHSGQYGMSKIMKFVNKLKI